MSLHSMDRAPDRKIEKNNTEVEVTYEGELFSGRNLGHIREQIAERFDGPIDPKKIRRGHRTPDGEFIEE